MKYAILTFGCRTNQADSFELERSLRARGGETAPAESAEVVFVNTCAVTATAEQAARQAIRRIARLNPNARLVATGCYASREGADLHALPVWRVLPNDHKERASDTAGHGEHQAAVRLPGPGTQGRTIHLLGVQTGCDERCAYCIVPSTRGRSRSRPLLEVTSQVSEAAQVGFKEVMITGVHLGAYGRDLTPRVALADLVRVLGSHPAHVRFRLSAVEPMDFDPRTIDAVRAAGRFAQHFHLPLQHASDRLLRAMARPYTLQQYDETVTRLRKAFPDAALGTDVIVGFPGETEEDFAACARYLASSSLSYLHVFPYSPRPGTAAASLSGRPPGQDVRARVHRLREISTALADRFRQRFAGTEREGLTIEDGATVLTDNYLRVTIPAGRARNERVRVRLSDRGGKLEGVVV